MINKKILYFAALAAFSMSLASCDDISEDNRVIPMERPEVKRTVLVQEFTGMRCTNCPDGARQVEAIHDLYSIVSVNMHPSGSPFTRPIDGLDLRSEEATAMYQYWQPTGFPAAVINGTTPNTTISDWMNAVKTFSGISSPVSLEIDATYDETTSNLTARYEISFNEIYAKPCSVMLWITENGIVGPQEIVGSKLTDYVHNHVLRASMNGVWGDEIGSSFIYDDIVIGTAEYTMPSAWVAKNCEVVAIVFRTDTKEVEQVTKVSLDK